MVSSGGHVESTEIYVKKILAGNIEGVRQRLVDAIESLGYDVIEDAPNIIARRGAKGWAGWFGSADVLDYATTLTVRLKPVGDNSTRAVFDYLVKHPMLNAGEKSVVVQEAKTIAAMSKLQAVEKICSVCETESTDDSKFCRKCGAPLTSEQSELEVLRMMAEIRAGKTSVVTASVLTVISTLLFAIALMFFLTGIGTNALLVLLTACGGLGLVGAIYSSMFGWNRLRRALKTEELQPVGVSGRYRETLESFESNNLPPASVPASVTEGTTKLLEKDSIAQREKEKVPVSGSRDTNDLE